MSDIVEHPEGVFTLNVIQKIEENEKIPSF